tara:strand:- start:424 stop:711 length:288 start_codon:yes stop_codon:yes gene_type:complete
VPIDAQGPQGKGRGRCYRHPSPNRTFTPSQSGVFCCRKAAICAGQTGAWQDAWETSDPDLAALLLRLFGTHLQVHSDRIMKTMIFERLDAVELAP